MTKITLERTISALVKPIIGLGIVGTMLALEPNSANAQTLPTGSDATSSDVQSTEGDNSATGSGDTTDSTNTSDTTSTADTATNPFEAAEARARENCKNTTLDSKLLFIEEYVKETERSEEESKKFLKQKFLIC